MFSWDTQHFKKNISVLLMFVKCFEFTEKPESFSKHKTSKVKSAQDNKMFPSISLNAFDLGSVGRLFCDLIFLFVWDVLYYENFYTRASLWRV